MVSSAKRLLAGQTPLTILAAAGFFLSSPIAGAQGVQHLTITQPGGMPGMPVMTGIQKTTNGAIVTWDGPSGYYQLVKKSGLLDVPWQPVGTPSLSRSANITGIYSNTFFRVSGPAPHYIGSQACAECHAGIHSSEMDTLHAQALETLKQIHQDKNPSCLPCHTVGYGLPTGFVSETATPQLAGVQCENCHGPAGNHAANEFDITVRPRVEVAATVCGGCHTGAQHPTFEEWKSSGHGEVTEQNMNPNSCGRCHVGPARIAMLKSEPVPQDDVNVGVVCTVCHDPHANRVQPNVLNGVIHFTNALTSATITITNNELGATYTNQLRNPYSSTKDYYLTTSDVFTNKYDPDVNVCAQCHNHRGADWTSSSRAPHHSPQYNMLIGTVGLLSDGSTPHFPSTHAMLEKQCVACHMQTEEHQDGPPEVAAVTGHKFEVDSYEVCAKCHGSAQNAQNFAVFVGDVVASDIEDIKDMLDEWALTKGAALLGTTNYGVRAWEYTNPGDLSADGGSGPGSADQAKIPNNIKKARFNLYIVLNDGSYGVHNGPYAFELLDAARTWVQQELDK